MAAGAGDGEDPGFGLAATTFVPGLGVAAAFVPGFGVAAAFVPGLGVAAAFVPGFGAAVGRDVRPGAGDAAAPAPGAPSGADPPAAGRVADRAITASKRRSTTVGSRPAISRAGSVAAADPASAITVPSRSTSRIAEPTRQARTGSRSTSRTWSVPGSATETSARAMPGSAARRSLSRSVRTLNAFGALGPRSRAASIADSDVSALPVTSVRVTANVLDVASA